MGYKEDGQMEQLELGVPLQRQNDTAFVTIDIINNVCANVARSHQHKWLTISVMKVVAQIGVILSALATQGMPASSLSLTAPFTRLLSLSRGGSRQIKPVGDYVGVNDTAPYLVEEMVAAETPKPRLNPLSEISAGTTVALASIPSSIAFASIAGVDPLVGVWSSVILGGVSAVTGMRPGLVAGAAGVVAVPLAGVVKQGPELMAPTIFLAAIMELVFATLKGGRLIELVRYVLKRGVDL